MRTDILYVVSEDETGEYGDLRLSLRSVAANGRGVGRVYVIGAMPEWVNRGEVTCVPCEDCHRRKHKNMLDKVVYGFEHTDVGRGSEHGMFMVSSDDHFYIRRTDMRWGHSPVWFNGDIHSEEDLRRMEERGENLDGWLHSMAETRGLLAELGYNHLMFSQHANTWFCGELMREKAWGELVYRAQGSEWGCEPSCLMGNYMLRRRPGWMGNLCWRRDVKVGRDDGLEVVRRVLVSGRECVSGSDGSVLGRVVGNMFGEKCKYER